MLGKEGDGYLKGYTDTTVRFDLSRVKQKGGTTNEKERIHNVV
jgi:hypothetical protein